jgi:hypothetical protein
VESLLFSFIETMIPSVFGMPIQMVFLRFSPENDPMFNEKSRKVFMDYMNKRDGLLKKHGLKSLAGWYIPYEHLTITVLEGSLDAINKLSMEPEFIAVTAYATAETKVALVAEEGMKMLKQAK